MKQRLVCVVVSAVLALPAAAWAQRRTVPGAPPIAGSPAESRVLAVMERMVSERQLYLAVSAENGRLLRLLAESSGSRQAVEIGTSTGYSSLWILLGLRASGGKLTTFEIDPDRAERARAHFREAGVDAQVEVVVGNAHQTVKRLREPIDLLFLDADKEGYASYLKTLLPLVRPGGIVAADNIEMAPDYYRAVTTDPGLDTVVIGNLAVTLKKR